MSLLKLDSSILKWGNNLISTTWEEVPAHVYPTDYEVFLQLEETSGLTAFDTSPNANDFINSGAIINETGKVGKCYRFENINNNYLVRNSAVINGSAFTIAMWTKQVSSIGTDNALASAWAPTQSYLLRIINPNVIQFYTYTTGQIGGNIGTIPDDIDWHFIVATYDGTTMKVYVDNILSPITFPQSGAILTNTEQFVGRYEGNIVTDFDGWIDQYMSYNRALSASEISQLWNNGLGV